MMDGFGIIVAICVGLVIVACMISFALGYWFGVGFKRGSR